MARVRSILWIGRGARFAAGMVAEAPSLDVVWERDVARAAELPLAGFDAIVLDAASAEGALAELASLAPVAESPVLVRLPSEEAHRQADLLASGAADVLALELGSEGDVQLLERIQRLTAVRAPAPRTADGIIGSGAAMEKLFALVAVAAGSQTTVLVSGETGTGKELVARAIHRAGPRQHGPFVAVNCAAFPDTLLDSELFGHVRGAFTGAERDRTGLFEEANGGTLFLDEVGETSGPFQAKLLRALQEREVRPLGGTRTRHVDVRIVAASNRDLRPQARAGHFRQDLYYRLAVFPIDLPPLRERRSDVATLARHFLEIHGGRGRLSAPELTPAAEQLLESHAWPGNVRELENEVQRALAMAAGAQRLGPEHFSDQLRQGIEPVDARIEPGDSLHETLGRIEAVLIRRALAAHANRRTDTARRLGITREGLYKKMKRLNIE